MKLAVIGIFHETNTFAPGRTEIGDFHGEWVEGNEAFLHRYDGTRTSMGGAIRAARDEGLELACGLYAAATPSGMVSLEAAEALIGSVLASVDGTADGVLAILHGAMVADGYPDMEGEFIRRLRDRLGPDVPLAITLDLHGNLSRQMIELTDLAVGYDTYPHVDAFERAVEAVGLLARTARGEIRPVRALSQPGLLIAPQAMLTEEEGPMRELMQRAFEIERDPKVLNVTVAGGFPYSDVFDAGFSFIVTTDGDQELADRYAADLARMAWERRERMLCAGYTAAEAVRLAAAEQEWPVILVEGSDNVGGGAPADATHVLEHLVGLDAKSLIVIRDAEAARLAHRLGAGARFEAEIGGKSDRLHGAPVKIEGTVRLLFDGKYRHIGEYMTGQWADMGLTAVIEAGQLTVVLTERRTAPWDPGHVASVGIRPEEYRIIVVKSAVAWKTAFGSVARKIVYVDTPGCCAMNVNHFEYQSLKRPIYPLDPMPIGGPSDENL